MASENIAAYREVALKFTQALAAREYIKAYGMTSHEFRSKTTVELLRSSFERIVPQDWGPIGPIEVGETMTSWREKQPSERIWAYVSIGGNVYSEAIIVTVATEDGAPRIRTVEFGRP
jgi:hypothetical protein